MPDKLNLAAAEIREVSPSRPMDRCCIDLMGDFKEGEGMLVGINCRAFFLVHSETTEAKYVSTRPFRVNAGPVSAYVVLSDKKTKYLCELKPEEDEVLIVDREGNTRGVGVARNKIETRPSLFVKAYHPKLEEIHEKYKGDYKILGAEVGEFCIFLQLAETIMLLDENGRPTRADLLKKGDKVLAWLENPEPLGRHFGAGVREKIIEI